jgi:hypothetical protein
MSDYLEHYRLRLERNNKELKELADNVIKADPEVEVYFNRNNELQNSLCFFKGESINGIAFYKVPYRWSGCGYSEFGKCHNGGENVSMPFDVNDVLTTFIPITNIKKSQPNNFFKSKEQYLKWYSFYEKYESK